MLLVLQKVRFTDRALAPALHNVHRVLLVVGVAHRHPIIGIVILQQNLFDKVLFAQSFCFQVFIPRFNLSFVPCGTLLI